MLKALPISLQGGSIVYKCVSSEDQTLFTRLICSLICLGCSAVDAFMAAHTHTPCVGMEHGDSARRSSWQLCVGIYLLFLTTFGTTSHTELNRRAILSKGLKLTSHTVCTQHGAPRQVLIVAACNTGLAWLALQRH